MDNDKGVCNLSRRISRRILKLKSYISSLRKWKVIELTFIRGMYSPIQSSKLQNDMWHHAVSTVRVFINRLLYCYQHFKCERRQSLWRKVSILNFFIHCITEKKNYKSNNIVTVVMIMLSNELWTILIIEVLISIWCQNGILYFLHFYHYDISFFFFLIKINLREHVHFAKERSTYCFVNFLLLKIVAVILSFRNACVNK